MSHSAANAYYLNTPCRAALKNKATPLIKAKCEQHEMMCAHCDCQARSLWDKKSARVVIVVASPSFLHHPAQIIVSILRRHEAAAVAECSRQILASERASRAPDSLLISKPHTLNETNWKV